MRKVICVTLIIVIIFLIGVKSPTVKGDTVKSKDIISSSYDNGQLTKSLSHKLIRFHVLANSDSVEDQTLKLKVRDEVLDYIAPKLRKAKSLDESRKILMQEDEAIKKVIYKVIKQNGYSYAVKTILSSENFPVKSYGNITLPQGKYEAYRIIIGKGNGQNWWCVMFPPLCFVDVTKSEASIKETEKEMKKVLTEKEYEAVTFAKSNIDEINNQEVNIESGNNEIILKFKFIEVFQNLKDKIHNTIIKEAVKNK
jgi:stage II sporulation protein R